MTSISLIINVSDDYSILIAYPVEFITSIFYIEISFPGDLGSILIQEQLSSWQQSTNLLLISSILSPPLILNAVFYEFLKLI